tara:strand:+ start:1070 stop:1261 length:192 start_codon:yes stop_codon:yes gene_type:complete
MRSHAIKIVSGFMLASAVFIGCAESSNEHAEYQCPMKCEGVDKTYKTEGKCPVCKMNLKEVEQ